MRRILFGVVVVAVVVLCASFLVVPSSRPRLQFTPRKMILGGAYRIETDKEVYSLGEPVFIKVYQKNLSPEPAQAGVGWFSIYILNSYGESVFGGAWHLFLNSEVKLLPSEEKDMGLLLGPWRQVNIDTGHQVPPDIYTIIIGVWDRSLPRLVVQITISG